MVRRNNVRLVLALAIGSLAGNAWAAYCDTLSAEALRPWIELLEFRPSSEIIRGHLLADGNPSGSYFVQPIEDAAGEMLNLDYYAVEVDRLPDGFSAEQLLERIRTDINSFVNTDVTTFEVFGNDRAHFLSEDPVGSRVHIEINQSAIIMNVNPDDAAVVLSDSSARHWRYTTITAPDSGFHPVSGNREWGFVDHGDGSHTFYTRGVDRLTTIVESNDLGMPFAVTGQDVLWRSFQSKLAEFIDANNGSAHKRAIETFREPWDRFVECLLAWDTTIADTILPNPLDDFDPALLTDFDMTQEHLFAGCPGREDMETSSTPNSITFRWVSGAQEGNFVVFAWGPPYLEDGQIKIDYWVEDFSVGSPPGFSLAIRFDGTARLPQLSALGAWEKRGTTGVPAIRDGYLLEVVWSTRAPFGYGCGPVDTVAHRYTLTRR